MVLNPLVMVMAINDDTRLTVSERVALVRAVKHTDNTSRQIHMSQSGIAEAVGVSRDTVKRAYAKALKLGYFNRRQQRRNAKGHVVTDYWFNPLPPLGAGGGTATGGDEKATVPEVCPVVQTRVQEKAPSTTSTSSTRSTQHPDAAKAPCFCAASESCQRCAPAKTEMCDLHGSFPKDSCAYCNRAPVVSRLPLAKQQQLYDRDMAVEKLNRFGEPLTRES